MSLLDKAKLLAKKKLQMIKANAIFKLNALEEKLFFDKPLKIELLKKAGIIALDLLISKLLSGGIPLDKLNAFLQKDTRAKTILAETSKDFDNESLSELLLACYGEADQSILPALTEDMSADDILKTISGLNRIDDEISMRKVEKLVTLITVGIAAANALKTKLQDQSLKLSIQSAKAQAKAAASQAVEDAKAQIQAEKERIKQEIDDVKARIVTYQHMLQHIINQVKIVFTKSEHPSPYRVKYLQRLLRNVYGLMKQEYERIKDQATKEFESIKRTFESLMDAFKNIDDLLIALALMTSIYLLNRLKLAKRSREALKEVAGDVACDASNLEPFDVSVNARPFRVTLDCPVEVDELIVPHTPIEEKLKALSCEIPQNVQDPIEGEVRPDLVTMAVIRNLREQKLDVKVTVDSFVTQESLLANLGALGVYSPTTGYIDHLSADEMVLRDILDPDEDYLETQVDLLNKKYERLNYVKAFLKDYNIESFYPCMLTTSTVDDASTRDVNTGIEDEWKNAQKVYKNINKEYEKQVEKVTGKDNVEAHAKNETLEQIKVELEEKQDIFYKNLSLLNEAAINASKKTKAKANEYELFEYYTLNLGMLFNGIENPNTIEVTFRDKINEYIRERIVIDGYKRTKIADKINDKIKEIEKGISTGNWFVKAFEIYSQKKKVDDVKKWLEGMAQKNKKLEVSQRPVLVNRVIFLFNLYLDYDEIVKKYQILAKETTKKSKTVEEGSWIYQYLKDLWLEYDTLPKDIDDIQKIIDSIALFSTYSIIEYQGKQARLYAITDKPKCEPEDEDFKPSSVGYDDIRYWLKYCSYATLASVTNPATGWSTGWIIPAPILLPVVYIPVKAISTKYGFIVVGVSICGIWIFPWVLMANLSANYTIPFGDPTSLLKREVQALKKEISEQLSNLKKLTIKPILDKTKEEYKESTKKVKTYKGNLKELRLNKPVKGSQVTEYTQWGQDIAETSELLATETINQWKVSVKADVLQRAYNGEMSLAGVSEALDAAEKSINAKLGQLESAIDNISNIMASLPISLSPDTANFGITLKNTKPIINIADELDDNVNEGILVEIIKKFKLKNSDFLSTTYGAKLSTSVMNYKAYKTALNLANLTIIKKDPFPKYEKLKPTNLPWLAFLYKDFVTTGAKTYGFPGQLPLPI